MNKICKPKLYSPIFVTETNEPSPWTDCAWASALMLVNKASANSVYPHGKYPATREEREALREASGDRTGGSTFYDVRRGIQKRYEWTLPLTSISELSLRVRLSRGDGAIVAGLYSELPKHYQRWDRKFAAKGDRSTHSVYVQGHDRAGNQHLDGPNGLVKDIFWCDPLGRGTYRGEWMPWENLMIYAIGMGNLGVATMGQGRVG